MNLIRLAERGFLPDRFVRFGIRRLLTRRLDGLHDDSPGSFAELLRQSPLAVETAAANRQHYEVPSEFFESVLGPRMKYSCCLFERGNESLEEAENAMLELTCERAEIADGMRVLDLGCGWGALSTWIAENYPSADVTAVSNSATQRLYIEGVARQRSLHNLRVITADMRELEMVETFDRIVSVEMFEHMRNYEELFRRIAGWLAPGGRAFAHVFCHRSTPYLFEGRPRDWMAQHFFTGGLMPSENLFAEFDKDLQIGQQWRLDGLHYWRTCEQWLGNLDRNYHGILARFCEDLDRKQAKLAIQRWRMFFLACAELFRFQGGSEWFVAHYLFHKVGSRTAISHPAFC